MRRHPASAIRPRAVVLVEGRSDQAAVEALARRQGRDLAAEGVAVVVMGGYGGIGNALHTYGPAGLDLELAGLVDAGEAEDIGRALQAAGLGCVEHHDLGDLGFFVCDADLEDELIRALGPATVEGVVEAEGELRAFRTFQRQPAHRDRPAGAQLRRFMGTKQGRKVRYGSLLVRALDLGRVPDPLEGVLSKV